MTPLTEPETEAEQNYNAAHARARNTVEMTFGRLKNKLRCLHKHRTLHYEPAKAAKIIIACCTLYNMFFDVLSGKQPIFYIYYLTLATLQLYITIIAKVALITISQVGYIYTCPHLLSILESH